MPPMCTRSSPRQHPAKVYGQGSKVERDRSRNKARSGAGQQKDSQVDLKHLGSEAQIACGSEDLLVFRSQAAEKSPVQPSKHLKSVVDQ